MSNFFSEERIAFRRKHKIWYVSSKATKYREHSTFFSRAAAIRFARTQDDSAQVHAPSGAISWSKKYGE